MLGKPFAGRPYMGVNPAPIPPRIPPFEHSAPQARAPDFIFPNLTLTSVVVVSKPSVNQTFDRQTVPARQQDFQFSNVALQAFSQLAVQPVGVELDETRAVIPPRQLDFQFPNLAAINASQLTVRPVGGVIDESKPKVDPRQLDFALPNLAVQLNALPVGKVLDETVPSPKARQLDFAFPNVSLQSFAQLAVKPVGAAFVETKPAATSIPTDAPIPNLLTTTLSAIIVINPPILEELADVPAPLQRVQDVISRNTALLTVTAVNPVGAVLDETVPKVQPRQLDFQFPNLLTAPASKPPGAPLFSDRPTGILAQDIGPPNIPALAAAQLQVKPVGSNLIFERRVATSIPTDAPIPNLLTTTLSVAPTQPIFNPIFERRPIPPQPQDNALPNLLVTILSTPVGIPFLPNISLMTDRPAPQSPPQDQFPVNLTINLPPPPATTELHQNPFFSTMGRLSQLGNLPS